MRITTLTFAGLVALAACSKDTDDAAKDSTTVTATADSMPAGAGVTADMRDAAGHDLGTLTLSESGGGIMLMGSLRGLPPGDHGVHLHMTGTCEAPFASAGGHWNPTSKQHGSSNPAGAHLGDLQNITVASDSTASVHLTTPGGTLKGENMLLDADGAAVVIHAKADDYKTDPSGNSGDRIACGVVKGS